MIREEAGAEQAIGIIKKERTCTRFDWGQSKLRGGEMIGRLSNHP
jgi:hypothetical protein